jgi:hypothetical protein
MPIQHAIWKVGPRPEPLILSKLGSEKELEDMITSRPDIISAEWMLIGRQEKTAFGGIIDLLAIAPDGSLVLIELKRDKTPREIVAQALDYASWVEGLAADKIAQIYERFQPGASLGQDFKNRFKVDLDEESLNGSHQIIIVAAELDESTERILGYLNARDIAINAIFFQVFQVGDQKLLSRAWLIDPGQTQVNATTSTAKTKSEKEKWNGEFYVSFGDESSRSWADATRYGYISAGGGSWYSQTLKMLSPGDRVWVKIPGSGYVGVGMVTEPVQSVKDFTVMSADGIERPALEVLTHRNLYQQNADDPDKAEYFVRVKWLDTLPRDQAFDEVGLFGNQNSVCQPSTPKWRHTIDRLKTVFPNWDSETRALTAKYLGLGTTSSSDLG